MKTSAQRMPPPPGLNPPIKPVVRSEIAQEIISRRPDFWERRALSVFLCIFLTLLLSTWFIRYPDIVQAHAVLTAYNVPKELMTPQAGRLVKLTAKNDQDVPEGYIIGWMESTASHEEVLELNTRLDSCVSLLLAGRNSSLTPLLQRRYTKLGELQPTYQQFISDWQQFDDYITNGYYVRKKEMLQQDLASINRLSSAVNDQKTLSQKGLILAEESFRMNDYLYKEKVISSEAFRNEQSRFLVKQAELPQLLASGISLENQQREKHKEIFELEHDMARQTLIFEQSLETLKSAIDEWQRKYVLRAPVKGKVAFIVPLQENRYLQQGRLLGYVIPDNARYLAEVTLPQGNFGKIDTGLPVQLRFDAYPYQEFGIIRGTLNFISKIPSDSGFLATIQFNDGLRTNYNKQLQYKSGLKAQALIITRDMRLLERIYYNISHTIKKGD